MKSIISIAAVLSLVVNFTAFSQTASSGKVVITGVRFAYPLLEKWIQDYKIENPGVEVSINPRGNVDPSQYDLLIEAYEQDKAIKETREYFYIGRYSLLPVANSSSAFGKTYGKKGLTEELIKQIFFHDIYADNDKEKKIELPYTVYTRLQKAGAPITFASYFGYTQQNIKGKAISGADEHLIKALLKDSTGVSYAYPGLVYDQQTRKQLNGLTVLPVDLDGSGRVNDDERIYDNLDTVIDFLENADEKSALNIPTEYFHFSIGKNNKNPEALKFLHWILNNGQEDLHQFGFLKPELKRLQKEKEKFEQLTVLN